MLRHTSLLLALNTIQLSLPAQAVTYEVTVGADGEFFFEPQWQSKNHSVTQSAFEAPCVLIAEGLDSGFIPVTPDTDPRPNWEVTMNDTSPTWFYCAQIGHCGMVFAINPSPESEEHSFTVFRDLAIQINGTGAKPSIATTASNSESTDIYVTPPPPSCNRYRYGSSRLSLENYLHQLYDTPEYTFAAEPAEHRIVVGAKGDLVFSPESITASIGDIVVFEFRPKNHTVTQSSFSNPCVRLVNDSRDLGFASGFQPVSAEATEFPEFRILINDTAPIWGYCGQTNHCGAGMVSSINAVESGPNNINAFKTLAQRINGTSVNADSDGSSDSSGEGEDEESAASVVTGVGLVSLVGIGLFVRYVGVIF
ncbi:hypothetical protein AX16_000688 [Volvariella volvacea WC 439]|nr:hypothetical protein AX16_000688 [Volvariella volvacea WC 439]